MVHILNFFFVTREKAFDAPTFRNDLPDEVRSAPTLACFREKGKSYLLKKGFSISMYKPSYVCGIMFTELDSGVAPLRQIR